MNKIKTIILLLFVAILTLTLNGFYLEYCVGRDMPVLLSTVAGFCLVVIDVLVARYAIKTILKLLNF